MASFILALPVKLIVELTDYIIDFLHPDVDALRACARVHSSWTPVARMHLYESVHLASLGPWNRLVDVLSQSPEIIPSIKHVTIDGQREFLQCAMQHSSKSHTLGGLLSNVESLSLSAVKLHEDPDVVNDFLRTHFLHIRRLRVNAVSAPDQATMQRVLISPRTTLEALSVSHVAFYCRDGPGLNILPYPELELDRFACTALVEVLETKMGPEVSPVSSHVRALSVHGLQTKCFPSLAVVLRNIEPSLEVFKVHMRGIVNQSYPEAMSGLLQPNTHLQSLTWVDADAGFLNFPQDLARVLAHAGSRRLQHVSVQLDPQGSDTLMDEADCVRGWSPLVQVLSRERLPFLKSLAVRWVCRGKDVSKTLSALFDSRLTVQMEAGRIDRSTGDAITT